MKTHDITAIPTVYNGIQLKSRMESKCALLFDKLGWKWEYEPFSVMLDGINYTPDFYVREDQCVLECRGYDNHHGNRQVALFAAKVFNSTLNIPGFPIKRYVVIGPDEAVFHDVLDDAPGSFNVFLCGRCGRWKLGLHDCHCGTDLVCAFGDLTVNKGQLFFSGYPPESWADNEWLWSPEGQEKKRISDIFTKTRNILAFACGERNPITETFDGRAQLVTSPAPSVCYITVRSSFLYEHHKSIIEAAITLAGGISEEVLRFTDE